ncbi:hypothetical protein [Campylobacter jejuni]|uniref:hypothetical protein n=1 Tax=Campylobacter jejuni TaxID=197 RepID=UPI000F6DB425|nr:hypothetical protein [Campylobacter jejuni]VEJ01767.1 Putative integral membrane protein [Campylobacter jejuni]
MKEFDEKLAQYGIFTINGVENIDLIKKEIVLENISIERIDFNILQEKGIKRLIIKNSEILEIYFSKTNNFFIYFLNCDFKCKLIAKKCIFQDQVKFIKCIFEKCVDFNASKFKSKVSFTISIFKENARFIKTEFLAKCNNHKIIENNFKEVKFCNNVTFRRAKFESKVSFTISIFKENARFIKTEFLAKCNNHKIIENNFSETIFYNKTNFYKAKIVSKIDFKISRFKGEIRFVETKFLSKLDNEIANNFREVVFEDKVYFNKTKINTQINFKMAKFKNNVEFVNLHNNVSFNNVNFKGIVNFENLNINTLNFKNVIFNNIVSFDNIRFDNNCKPNFENCTFSDQFNIEHKYIEYKFDEIEKTQEYDKLLNYRDLFRKLKSNRIAHHNLIDASELRAQELYARELELKHKENKSLKEKIERWQLVFYRKLCDHHTDLLLNLKWLVVVIGLFALLYFASRMIQDISLLKALNQYGVCLSIVGVFNLLCLYWFGCIKNLIFLCILI